MRRLLVVPALLVAATFAPAPASATHCEIEYKDIHVCVCLTVADVVRDVTGEQLHCA